MSGFPYSCCGKITLIKSNIGEERFILSYTSSVTVMGHSPSLREDKAEFLEEGCLLDHSLARV